MKIRHIIEADEPTKFPKRPEREGAPPGYSSFIARGRHIIGIKADGTEVEISTTTPEAAKAIVAIWNAGKTLEKVPLYKMFGPDFYGFLMDRGYKMVEKPSTFSYIDAQESRVPRSVVEGQWNIPVWDEMTFDIRGNEDSVTYDGLGNRRESRYSLYPLCTIEPYYQKMEQTVVEIRLDDGRRYYAERYKGAEYFRFWIRIEKK